MKIFAVEYVENTKKVGYFKGKDRYDALRQFEQGEKHIVEMIDSTDVELENIYEAEIDRELLDK